MPPSLRSVDQSLMPPGVAPRNGRPPITSLNLNGFVVSVGDGLDRAGNWIQCYEPLCPNRAYLLEFFASREQAVIAAVRRGGELARTILPRAPERLAAEGLPVTIWRIAAAGVRGRDYRRHPCGLPDASEQLRLGDRNDPAWQEICRQRDADGVEGAILPSADLGTLFLFLTATSRLRRCARVEDVVWRGGADMAA